MKFLFLALSVLLFMSAKGCGYDPAGLEPKLVNLAANKVYKYTILEGKPEIKVSDPVELPLNSIDGHFCLTPAETAEIRREWEKWQ